MRTAAFAAALLLQPGVARAQTAAEAAAANMRIALDICLTNYLSQDRIPGALRAAGFSLTPGMDAGSWEFSAPRVDGLVAPGSPDGGVCNVSAPDLPRAQGEAIGRDLAGRRFAGQVQDGAPEGRAACPTISIFAPRLLMTMEFLNPGNAGTCASPNGATALLIM